MTAMIREPECVVLKRRGAEHVAKLITGMSLQEQLEFWRKRTKAMLVRQEESHQKKTIEPLAKLSTGKRSKLIKAPDKPVF